MSANKGQQTFTPKIPAIIITDKPIGRYMKTGQYVRHPRNPHFGVGRIVEKYINSSLKVVFPGVTLTGIMRYDLEPVQEQEQRHLELEEARKKGPEAVKAWENEQKKKRDVILEKAIASYAGCQRYSSFSRSTHLGTEAARLSAQMSIINGRAKPENEEKRSALPGSNWWYLALKERKSRSESSAVETKVIGVTFENRQKVIASMQADEQVLLVREQDNLFDCNAVAVKRTNGHVVGYLPCEVAARVAEYFNEYGRPVNAVVISITGRHMIDAALGVRIRFSIPIIKR